MNSEFLNWSPAMEFVKNISVNSDAFPSGTEALYEKFQNSFPAQVIFGLAAAWLLSTIFLGRDPVYTQYAKFGVGRFMSLVTFRSSVRWTIDKLTHEGYNKVAKPQGKPFVLNWWGLDTLFMPPKYLDDVRKASFDDLSFFEILSNAFHLKSSVGDLYSTNTMIEVCKRKLNPQLPTLIPILNEEADWALQKEFGNGREWKELKANEACSLVLHRVTSRILIGEELCRDQKYIDSSIGFSMSVFMNGVIWSTIPLGPFRTTISKLGSFYHRRNLQKNVDLLLPVIRKRMEERKDPNYVAPVDAMDWTLELASPEPKEQDPTRLAHQILQNLWAASGAPGGLVTQLVYQILMCPEYMQPLREEITAAVKEHGWTETALNRMVLTDSFIREVNRVYPNGCITAARTVMGGPFQFHDGLVLPEGSRFAFPIGAIMQDPDNFPSPQRFDGFRFARLTAEQQKKDPQSTDQTYAASTATKTNLAFGYGRHACVGRFYAVRKVKLVFAKLITEYDMAWVGDVVERPRPFSIEGQIVPNMEQKIRVRKRV